LFGKGILKLIGLAIAGAMALAGGAQLLSSVAHVIISFRSGDIVPLLLAICITLALIQMRRLLADNSLSAFLGILTYAASGYLALLVFVGLLQYGMVSSLLGASLTIIVCSVMYDPSFLNEWIAALSTDSSISWMGRGQMPSELTIGSDASHQLVLVPPESREKIIGLMSDRPLLPISLTHFNECDVLFINTTSKRTRVVQVRNILTKAGISIRHDASPLLRDAIIKVPLIDEKHGLAMADYCLAIEPNTVDHLIHNMPSRMIVFPSKTGPRVIYPESAAPGLISLRVPENELVNALILHRYTNLEEVNDTLANPT
jgi:hypothetical protein